MPFKPLKALMQGGPLGLFHAAREAWVSHRIYRVSYLMDQEREIHRQYTEQLRMQMRRLLLRQAHINQRAAAFWRAMSS